MRHRTALIGLLLAVGCNGAAALDVPLSDGWPPLVDARLAGCSVTETWEDDGRLLTERVYDGEGRLESLERFRNDEVEDALAYTWRADRVDVSPSFVGPTHTYEHDETVWFDPHNQVVRRRVDSEWVEYDQVDAEKADSVRTLDDEGLPAKETHDLNLDDTVDWRDSWSWDEDVAEIARNGEPFLELEFSEERQLVWSTFFVDGEVGSETAYSYAADFPERIERRGRVVSGEPLPQNLYTWACPL